MAGRSPLGVAFVVAPIVAILLVFLGYGILIWYGLEGQAATGPEQTVVFEACPEARAVIEGRVGDMGLQAAWAERAGGFSLTAIMPTDAEVREDVPALLSSPGHFEVRDAEGAVLFRTPRRWFGSTPTPPTGSRPTWSPTPTAS